MTNRIYLPANRSNIDSFYVMELLYNANKLEANGKKIFHLELGEPIPKTPKAVLKEASRLSRLSLPVILSNGIEELREKIFKFYKYRYNLKINSEPNLYTTGSSGAFLLTFYHVSIKVQGRNIYPVYPAYRNILKSLNIDVVEIFPDNKNIDKIDLSSISKQKIDGLIISILIILMVRLLI